MVSVLYREKINFELTLKYRRISNKEHKEEGKVVIVLRIRMGFTII